MTNLIITHSSKNILHKEKCKRCRSNDAPLKVDTLCADCKNEVIAVGIGIGIIQ